MTEERDEALLRELKTMQSVRASEDFTARVVAAAGRRRRRRHRQRQLALGAAAIVLLAVLFAPLARERSTIDSSDTLAGEAETLRREYREIRAELEALEARAERAAPVIYLGGDDDLDLVVDLASFMAQPSAMLPASTSGTYEF
jgi:hypothetical protein